MRPAMAAAARLTSLTLAALAMALAVSVSPGATDPSSPAVEEKRQPTVSPSADSEYDRGVRARVAGDWKTAEAAFRRAIALRASFADAWNELGYALRHQKRYAESVKAYDEALRLRPDFPEALEYLGEAYVDMGRLEDARRILTRLRPLDPARARELAEAIQNTK